MTSPMPSWCVFCRVELDENTRAVVGHRESASGPGWPVCACSSCMVAYRVIPFAEHPKGSDGSIRYRDRQPFAPRSR